ncbi:DCC1-like thiol-disulfide oxidoreductase family protein [Sulfurovum sp.]|uniref:DCC1-like thiol-disulfide oxidoreductase family protein n=1 Tax=Sulfurovum sp. TaxID=1969726 RepID=UPI0025E00F4B|nr:DCC1-like thiol-disulfide oxidoreductase family protein [Sulfurovum sp.]
MEMFLKCLKEHINYVFKEGIYRSYNFKIDVALNMKKSYLFYDGACPFCNQYAKFKELRECIDLELCDARQNMLWKELNPRLNLDDGIILVIEDGAILQGVEAIAYLDNICTFKGAFFKLQKFIFSNQPVAYVVYGILKFFRKLL